jgi:hypothetical protein
MDTSSADQVLTQGVAIFSKVGIPWLAAVGSGVFVSIWVFLRISNLVERFVKCTEEDNQRKKDAIAADMLATQRALEDQTRREKGNYLASVNIWDASWVSRLNYTVTEIKNNRYESVFGMVNKNDAVMRDKVSAVLYNSAKTAEGRAVEIITFLKGAS